MYTILLVDKDGRPVQSWRSSSPKPEDFPREEFINPGDRVYRFETDEDLSDYVEMVHNRLHELEVEDDGDDILFIDHAPEHAKDARHFQSRGRPAFRAKIRVAEKRRKDGGSKGDPRR